MEQTEESVWIVIPLYNTAATLPKCLDSLLRQTYSKWTACLIDDGSTDNSLEIGRQYAALDSRFICLANPQNQGPSAARNQGIQNAQGTYVAFLDSDDWWDDCFLERMVGAARQFQADFVQCGWTLEWPGGQNCPEENTYPDFRVFDRDHFGEPLAEMLGGISMNHVARKLVRRSLMEGLCFSTQLSTAEDLAMSFELLMRAQRIVFVPEPLYHYYRHGGGLTGSALGFRQKWAANRAVARMMQKSIRGTEFDTVRFRFLVWARPYRLLVSKAARLLRDKFHQSEELMSK